MVRNNGIPKSAIGERSRISEDQLLNEHKVKRGYLIIEIDIRSDQPVRRRQKLRIENMALDKHNIQGDTIGHQHIVALFGGNGT